MKTVEEELIQQLCAELDVLTADVSVPPGIPPVESVGIIGVVATPEPRRLRRRAWVLVAATIALIGGVVGLVAVRRDHQAAGTNDIAVETAPASVTSTPAPAGIVHPVPATPDGWDLVEWSSVRLSVPPELSPFQPGNGCAVTTSEDDLRVACGDRSLHIGAGKADAATSQLVNDLQASWESGPCAGCLTLILPELATTVTVGLPELSTTKAVLLTVSPSGSWRSSNERRLPAPVDWKTVTFRSVSIKVPPDWPVETPDAAESCEHAGIQPNTVTLGTTLPDQCRSASALLSPSDGVRLFLAAPPLPIKLGWALSQVAVEPSDSPWVVLRVGYGADPIVGQTILDSLTSVGNPADTTATFATVAIPDVPYFAIGESVMLGAKPMLDAAGIMTSAAESRQAFDALEAIAEFTAGHRITTAAVIHVGTNGVVTREEYDAILANFSNLKLVVVLTVEGDRPWVEANNEIIRSLPAAHPNVKIVDWEVRRVEVGDHLGLDGIHLADDTARNFYATLILEGLALRP